MLRDITRIRHRYAIGSPKLTEDAADLSLLPDPLISLPDKMLLLPMLVPM